MAPPSRPIQKRDYWRARPQVSAFWPRERSANFLYHFSTELSSTTRDSVHDAAMGEHGSPVVGDISSECCRNVTVAFRGSDILVRNWNGTDRTISLFVPVGWGDHGMNQRFQPLTCFFSLVLLLLLSRDAAAVSRDKQVDSPRRSN